jgi:O-antigen/teichoic acid export membrane protein
MAVIKAFVKRLNTNPAYAKIFEWGKLITISGSAQILVQLFSFMCGILIIRLLTTGEYALYTLANAMLGTMTLLADGGIADGVLSQGGKVWKNRTLLGAVITTGLDLRKKFAIGSLCVAIPLLVYLLMHHGAKWPVVVLLVLSLIPSFFIALSGTILEIAPKLWQDILPLQKNQVALNIGRLAMLGLLLFSFPFSFVAILATAIPQVWANYRLRQISTQYADRSQLPDPVVRTAILKIVKRTMPGAVYYCFYGQITTWLISIFGSTESLAKVGALSRLAVVLNVFTALFATLVVPRFARLPAHGKLLLNRFLQVQLCLVLISVCITGAVLIFPSKVLFLLGNNYAALTTEVGIIALSSCIGMMMGVTYAISLSRGWVLHPVVLITGNVLTQLILLYTLNLSKIQNVLWFSVINNSVAFLMLFCYYLFKVYKIPLANKV